ncbi:hypothetical protein [Paenibacillus jiagnxiensis]|uniref:hypothetical protein n=1 Tax=Paenibacillus jiagnxiensis TaxID=3228926 RepID=UPI0033B70204
MTNNEARAYAALAMERCNISSLTAVEILDEMWNLFYRLTEHDAVEAARPIMVQFELNAKMLDRNGFHRRISN